MGLVSLLGCRSPPMDYSGVFALPHPAKSVKCDMDARPRPRDAASPNAAKVVGTFDTADGLITSLKGRRAGLDTLPYVST